MSTYAPSEQGSLAGEAKAGKSQTGHLPHSTLPLDPAARKKRLAKDAKSAKSARHAKADG
jgi:hypothetical protein